MVKSLRDVRSIPGRPVGTGAWQATVVSQSRHDRSDLDMGSIPGHPVGRGAWQATVVSQSRHD